MNLRKKSNYALLAPTSMGLRLTPDNAQPFHLSHSLRMEVSSAETNVLSVASFLGMPVKVLTAFVKDSPVARFIKDDLAGRHMDYEGPEIEQGHPWGVRHQMNLADSGFGSRGPLVYNDRAGEVGRLLKAADFDLVRIFEEEGVQIMHLSGLIAALSPETGQLCRDLAETAQKNGTKVSFDLNYRASFWKGREEELRAVFLSIAEKADILVGNEEDFQLCLGLDGPQAGGTALEGQMESFQQMIGKAKQRFPKTQVFAATLREVLDAGTHLWGALMAAGDHWYSIPPRQIKVLDRIGGGDGFVGGLLYGVLKGWPPQQQLEFGWASGALVVSLLTDYAQPLNEKQIWNIGKGNARVQR